jgi:hypothetical protein
MKLSGESANLEFDTGTLTIQATQSLELFIEQTINLRRSLGDMFDKYDEFLMVFNSIGSSANSTTANSYTGGTSSNQNNTAIWTTGMSGDLQFRNNTINGSISSIAYFPPRYNLPVATVANGSNILLNFPVNNGIVFLKPSNDIVRIKIAPYLVRGGGIGSVVAGAADLTFDANLSFTVFGLMKDEVIKKK